MRQGIVGALALLVFALGAAAAPTGESPKDVIAAQVRLQGHPCDSPLKAARDRENSKPDVAAWVLECRNATYRVRLIPHKAAIIEREERH